MNTYHIAGSKKDNKVLEIDQEAVEDDLWKLLLLDFFDLLGFFHLFALLPLDF